MTGEMVYWHNSWLSTGSKRYRDIKTVSYEVAKVAGMHIVIDQEKITIGMGEIVEIADTVARILLTLSKAARRSNRTRTSSG